MYKLFKGLHENAINLAKKNPLVLIKVQMHNQYNTNMKQHLGQMFLFLTAYHNYKCHATKFK